MGDHQAGNKEVQKPMFNVEGPHIVFDNGTMRTGQNYTIRLGDNWAERKGIRLGEIYKLTTVDGGYCGEAIITHLLTCQLKDVPKEVISRQSDKSHDNPIVLYHFLMTVYPDAGVKPETFVTCVGFQILGGGA